MAGGAQASLRHQRKTSVLPVIFFVTITIEAKRRGYPTTKICHKYPSKGLVCLLL